MTDKESILKINQLLEVVDTQSGYFRVIYYLYAHIKGHINKMSADLSMGDQTLYRIFDILQNQKIIEMKEKKGKTKAIRKNYYLTDKGKEVARKMVEMIIMIQ